MARRRSGSCLGWERPSRAPRLAGGRFTAALFARGPGARAWASGGAAARLAMPAVACAFPCPTMDAVARRRRAVAASPACASASPCAGDRCRPRIAPRAAGRCAWRFPDEKNCGGCGWTIGRCSARGGACCPRSRPISQSLPRSARGGAAVEAARTRSPDIVLMDLRLPGLGGVEAPRRLKAAQPAAPVIVHTTSGGGAKKSSPPCAPVPSATCSTPRPRQNWAQPSAAPPAARACGQSLAWTASTRRSFFSASPAVCLPSSSRRLPWAPAKAATGLAVGHDPRPRHARAARECRPALVHPPLLRLLRVRCLLDENAPAGNPRGRWPEGLAPAATGLFAFFLIGYDLLAPQIDASVAILGIVFGILILRLVGQDVRRFCRLPRSRSGVFFT